MKEVLKNLEKWYIPADVKAKQQEIKQNFIRIAFKNLKYNIKV